MNMCVICGTDVWESNWFSSGVHGYKLGGDPCSCPEGQGWSSEMMMCMDGSTTNCSECPTMDRCDTSTCEQAMCPGYDPNRVCQCNSNCDAYEDCCDDAYACIQDPCDCPEEMGWNSIMQMCMEGSMTTCAECPYMDECYDDSMGDGVLCPGHSIEDFCDCDGDCFEQPALCSCAEAQACCNTEPMTTDEVTTAPAAGILCPDMPITDYC